MKILFVVILPLFLLLRNRSKKRYPPGPPGWPIIGNLFDLPWSLMHEKLTQYSKDLGSDIIYLNIAGTPFISLTSLKVCNDLLDKHSSVSSSRPRLTMLTDLMNGRRFLGMQSYGDEWREGRRIIAKHLGGPDKTYINDCITRFVRRSLLPNFLHNPEDFFTHMRNGVGGSIIALAYGLPIKRVNDPWIALAEKALNTFTGASISGKYAVDILPFLQYIPEWFPGAGFHKYAREAREIFDRFFDEPFEASRLGMVNGTAKPSFVSKSLEGLDGRNEEIERIIVNIGGTFVAGGIDSNVTAVKNFLIMLLLFPDIQAKAQAEVDTIVRTGRLPELEDKPRLLYLRAVLKELLRWRPIVPTNLPHLTTEDDEYMGYFIPKGSFLMANTWAILNDEKVFPEPSKFDPTRFLTPDGQLKSDKNLPDPEVDATFGFGRRICPGVDFGLATFWLSAACILACFDVTPPLDKDGNPISQEFEWPGKESVNHPEPFKCSIKPRSNEAVSLILEDYDEASEYV